MYLRNSTPFLLELLDEFRILYLTGPRQAGKTTLAKAIAAERGMQYLSLDEEGVLAAAQNDPHGFIHSFTGQNVVLDEFQYAPELTPAIKRASDNLPPEQKGKFLLTGSADIFSSARTQEALPGHMARVELWPLSVTEICDSRFNLINYLLAGDFSQQQAFPQLGREQLAQILLDGGYPEVQSKSTRGKSIWFKSYIQGRLFKDFETLYAARGEYHAKLQALIPYLAGLSGNLLKYASIANDLAQNDRVIKSYIEALEWMFIIKRIYPFAKNSAKRQTVGMPKLHMVDTGLACHLLGITTARQLATSAQFGNLLESFIVMECFKHMGWADEEVGLYHFRDTSKNEVDIVLERSGGKLIGIEVKASASVGEADFKGLAQLAEFVGDRLESGLVFYSGERVLPFRVAGRQFFAVPVNLLLAPPPESSH
jgi:predicted AAA+ superfamily ATPase